MEEERTKAAGALLWIWLRESKQKKEREEGGGSRSEEEGVACSKRKKREAGSSCWSWGCTGLQVPFLSQLRKEEEELRKMDEGEREGLSRLPSAHNKHPDGMLSAPA